MMLSSSTHKRRLLFLQLLIVFFGDVSKNNKGNVFVDAALSCSDDSYCEQMIRPGSYCIKEQQDEDGTSMNPTGVCSNPFEQGCLKTLLPEKLKSSEKDVDELRSRIEDYHTILEGRICNSDDVDDSERQKCKHPLFHYPEIRIHNSNWESAIFLSWIFQIVLMEILEVPVAIGLGPSGVGHGSGIQDNTYDASFYNPYNFMSYSSKAYPWDAVKVANDVGDCNNLLKEKVEDKEIEIPPCAQFLPDVWNGQTKEWNEALIEGYIDPLSVNGQVGKLSWFIPVYTASQYDSTLISFYGLRGEENRHKAAEAFKRPLQWKVYCEKISLSNCTEPDTVATHYPVSEFEQTSYFSSSHYTGYFHLSDKNNCTKNPTTCTGLIVAPPCTWSTNVDSQIYWNNLVGLEPDGPLEPNGGYSYSAMTQIWRAANATKSNVIMWWWKPDVLVEEFFNTSYEFQEFLLPEPSLECANARVNAEARCSDDISIRRGLEDGACDLEAHAAYKVYAKSLRELTFKESNVAYRSPAYTLIENLRVTDLQLAEMMRRWIRVDIDKYGYDPREAVCTWVIDNLDSLLDTLPEGYPRILNTEDSSHHDGYRYVALAVAICTNLVVWITVGATYYYRNTRVMRFSQVWFLQLILFGFGLISIGAIIGLLQPPTDQSCTIVAWLIVLGYTIELVPLLVKISTINRMVESIKNMRRTRASPANMAQTLTLFLGGVICYLVIWTTVDPLSSFEEHTLVTPNKNEGGGLSELDYSNNSPHFVSSNIYCHCKQYVIWSCINLGYQGILLIIASVLAFQSQNIQEEFNESRRLGMLVYSHFLFLLLRIVVTIIENRGLIVSSTIIASTFSLLYSFDTLTAIFIYILPKIREAATKEDFDQRRKYRSSLFQVMFGANNFNSETEKASDNTGK